MLDLIFGAIGSFLSFIGRIVSTIIDGAISFAKHVVGWFRGLSLQRDRDIPFVVDANSDQFQELLDKAPELDAGIFEGVYDTETHTIKDYQYIEAEDLDERTAEIFEEHGPIVILK